MQAPAGWVPVPVSFDEAIGSHRQYHRDGHPTGEYVMEYHSGSWYLTWTDKGSRYGAPIGRAVGSTAEAASQAAAHEAKVKGIHDVGRTRRAMLAAEMIPLTKSDVALIDEMRKALPVVAIGPRGGKIVGYGKGRTPIYQGSDSAKELERRAVEGAGKKEMYGEAKGPLPSPKHSVGHLKFATGDTVDVKSGWSDKVHRFIIQGPPKQDEDSHFVYIPVKKERGRKVHMLRASTYSHSSKGSVTMFSLRAPDGREMLSNADVKVVDDPEKNKPKKHVAAKTPPLTTIGDVGLPTPSSAMTGAWHRSKDRYDSRQLGSQSKFEKMAAKMIAKLDKEGIDHEAAAKFHERYGAAVEGTKGNRGRVLPSIKHVGTRVERHAMHKRLAAMHRRMGSDPEFKEAVYRVAGVKVKKSESVILTPSEILAKSKYTRRWRIKGKWHYEYPDTPRPGSGNRRDPIDPDEHPPIIGMEGPFRYKSGRIAHYDPREGKYYDAKQDMYLTHEDVEAMHGMRSFKSEGPALILKSQTVIATGPRGGKIVGYSQKGGKQVPIYLGSAAATRMAGKKTEGKHRRAATEADALARKKAQDRAKSARTSDEKRKGDYAKLKEILKSKTFEAQVKAKKVRAPKGAALQKVDPLKDSTGDGVADGARVGLAGKAMNPPPPIPRLPNLMAHEREAETEFADAIEADPTAMVEKYKKAFPKEWAAGKIEVDHAKMLSPHYNPARHKGESDSEFEDRAKRSMAIYNTALHTAANALAKKIFIAKLDELSKLPPAKRMVLVTSGGCAAGKGWAQAKAGEIPDLAKAMGRTGAVWDAAGEANATENPWVLEECKKRGIKPVFLFMHYDGMAAADAIMQRAADKGRMVDLRLAADSYAIGGKNFKAFAESQRGKADFIFAERYKKDDGKEDCRILSEFPEAAAQQDHEELYRVMLAKLEERYQAGEVSGSIMAGGTAGVRIWSEDRA